MSPIRPDWLLFEGEDIQEEIRGCRLRFRKTAISAAAVCLIITAVSAALQFLSPPYDEMLARNAYGGGSKAVDVSLGFLYEGERYDQQLTLNVLEKELGRDEAEDILDQCEKELPGMVEMELNYLLLPSEWNGIVSLSWRSGDPDMVSDEGRIAIPETGEDMNAVFTVVMNAGGWIRETVLSIPADISDADPRRLAEAIAEDISEELSSDGEGDVLGLPAEYRGMALDWSPPGIKLPTALLPLLILLVSGLYFSRYDALKKESEKRLYAFNDSVPDLSLRLVLLLNSGLVLNAALEELLHQTRDDPSPLYRKMNELRDICDASNSSFEAALSDYSASTGNRDLMRIAAMIYESSGRGSELAGKLEAERGRQWYERLNAAKAKASEAETKLCLPLMILLIVLVIIAAAPALMNM